MTKENKSGKPATAAPDQQGPELSGERWPTARGFWTIFPELCKGCGLCLERCPTGAIRWGDGLGAYGANRVTVDAAGCVTCKICAYYCPDAAISVVVK
ncbi:MAG TPA: 4Fe-4S binding protein [Capillibacterium sp.]